MYNGTSDEYRVTAVSQTGCIKSKMFSIHLALAYLMYGDHLLSSLTSKISHEEGLSMVFLTPSNDSYRRLLSIVCINTTNHLP